MEGVNGPGVPGFTGVPGPPVPVEPAKGVPGAALYEGELDEASIEFEGGKAEPP